MIYKEKMTIHTEKNGVISITNSVEKALNNSGIKSMVIISVLFFSIYFLLFKTLHIDLLVFYKTRLSVCIRKN